MEDRKIKEIEYYNKEAKEIGDLSKEAGSLAGFDPFVLSSYKFLSRLIKEYSGGKIILDFGCGMGLHLKELSEKAKEVVGIDLSEKSLEIARKTIEKENIRNAKVILMDAEKLEFPDNHFDMVFDGGTFSSIDLQKGLSEIMRVLKPGGVLIGIETFGHNPLTNLKRIMNKKTGRRTEWATEHILKMKDLKYMEKFGNIEAHFFHLISWVAFPFFSFPAGKIILKIGEGLDRIITAIFPFFKKYSFKAVFILKKLW